MGWLDLGKPNKDINVDALFREAEQKERLLKELEANPMGSISARPLKQEDQSALFGSTLDNKG